MVKIGTLLIICMSCSRKVEPNKVSNEPPEGGNFPITCENADDYDAAGVDRRIDVNESLRGAVEYDLAEEIKEVSKYVSTALQVLLTKLSVNDPRECNLVLNILKENKALRIKIEALQKELEGSRKCSKTGLFNDRYIPHVLDLLGQEVEYAVLFIDLNHFKQFNDQFTSHAVGDEALRYLADKIKACRSTDLLVKCEENIGLRWGGDEFMMVLPNTNINGGISVARRLNELLLDDPFKFQHPESQEIIEKPISVSIGVASGQGSESFEDVKKQADKAVYFVKEELGRRGVAVLSSSDSTIILSDKDYLLSQQNGRPSLEQPTMPGEFGFSVLKSVVAGEE